MVVHIVKRERMVTMDRIIHDGERLEDLGRRGRVIIQATGRFCFGSDAVFLAHFVKAGRKDKLLDIGTGTGIIPILCEALYDIDSLTGLEIQQESADMARRSVIANHLENKIDIVTGDICNADNLFKKGSFSVITTNPPYMIGGHGIVNPSDTLAMARHEISCTLQDILEQSEKLLCDGGHFYMVHRPFRLPEIMTGMCTVGIEPKRLRLVYTNLEKEPTMVLIEGVKKGKPRLTVEKPLIVFKEDGTYTDEVKSYYGESDEQ